MSQARQLLKQLYIDNLKTDSKLYVGVEFEFPIVNMVGRSTDIHVSKGLFDYLGNLCDFDIIQYDQEGHAIDLRHKTYQDHLVFEVSYNLIEFAFGCTETIQEIEQRFDYYLGLIQPWLSQHGHMVQGFGIHPSWSRNDNGPVKIERYEMLIDYLKLSETKGRADCHHFPDYGGFICGSQVQLDVTVDNYLRAINAFNKVEAVKAYLFANSPFNGADWDTLIARDIFWEQSMHGYHEENIGIFPKDFKDTQDFLDWMEQTSIYTAERKGHSYYFPPIRVKDYLSQETIAAYALDGTHTTIIPETADFKNHRAYHYQDLTKRGTIEFRSTCAQPIDKSFLPIAFHLGLMANLEKLESLLETEPLFEAFNHDYKAMRRYFSKPDLGHHLEAIHQFSRLVLECALDGLLKRGYGEEVYLKELIETMESSVRLRWLLMIFTHS